MSIYLSIYPSNIYISVMSVAVYIFSNICILSAYEWIPHFNAIDRRYCIVLYCIVLYCIILYYIILYCII